MKKLILAAAVAGAVLLSSAAQAQTTPEGYQLQQVLMMSRHNLRAPLANNGSVLEQSTPNQWPEWDVPGGQLTTKGGVLEIYMGHYMREWLAELGMVTSGECPTPDTVYTYANSLQRTVATAQDHSQTQSLWRDASGLNDPAGESQKLRRIADSTVIRQLQ